MGKCMRHLWAIAHAPKPQQRMRTRTSGKTAQKGKTKKLGNVKSLRSKF